MTTEKSTIQTEYGEYVPLYQRLPDFHREFPLNQGYCIEIDVRDPLSFKPGLLALYQACVSNGVSPETVGLPRIPVGPELVFTAKLVKDGRVLNSASNLRIIEFEKDFARGETGSRQRLIAACGFPGNPADLEEMGTSSDAGLRVDFGGQSASSDDEDFEDLDSISEPDPANDETPPALDVPQAPQSDMPAHLQNQVDTICASLDAKNADYKKPTTKSEALKFIRTHRGGNGASQ